jgi:hypothetical protein
MSPTTSTPAAACRAELAAVRPMSFVQSPSGLVMRSAFQVHGAT